mmetsp:Transcript_120861/g.341726  ORF Transcript_120861/g.341726 Transcript_120861/m.341726 type:complete len:88 (+) Transcript_120861:269-532(+)
MRKSATEFKAALSLSAGARFWAAAVDGNCGAEAELAERDWSSIRSSAGGVSMRRWDSAGDTGAVPTGVGTSDSEATEFPSREDPCGS